MLTTPSDGFPKRETFLTWQRSHGDSGGTRYSALSRINRNNVTNLQVAWTYHSRDGSKHRLGTRNVAFALPDQVAGNSVEVPVLKPLA